MSRLWHLLLIALWTYRDIHDSQTHRNKDLTEFIYTKSEFEVEEAGHTRKYNAGELAHTEYCDVNCTRKGQGHSHPILSPGP